MQSRMVIPLQGSVTLRRHFVSLVPRLLTGVIPGLGVLAAGMWLHRSGLLILGAALALAMLVLRIAAWRVFTISVRYDRIRIRYFGLGVQQITYPIPGLRGLTCRQHPIGMLWDTGTLILTLPDKTLEFTMLTPYSMLNDALGW